jgi:hypothetical protein
LGQNNETGKQETLRTKDRAAAERILNAKNEATRQPFINLQIARAYLQASYVTIFRAFQDVALRAERIDCGVKTVISL